VFVSSTLQELAEERRAARAAIERLRLAPVMFELGARPHPPRDLYRAYLEQSHVFVGLYWQRYGWVAPGETVSGLEDEYNLCGDRPKLIYVKHPASEREARLEGLLERIRGTTGRATRPFLPPRSCGSSSRTTWPSSSPSASRRPRPRRARPSPVALTACRCRPRRSWGGRDEVEAVRGLLLEEGVRLVTLVGPGGVGKTRLALEVAAGLRDAFPDGVCFVPLAARSRPGARRGHGRPRPRIAVAAGRRSRP
jgi:hypothetical protein